jgi:hypothetical protein
MQLKHLNDEEKYIIPMTYEYLDESELLEIRSLIQKSYSAEDNRILITWFIKALNPYELTDLLIGIRADASQSIFDNVLQIAKDNLSEQEWDYLMNLLQ